MITPPNHGPASSDDWQPAGGGEIVRLARSLRERKSRRQFLKAGGGIVGGVIAAAGGWWIVRSTVSEGEYKFGGMTCSEVAARADDLMHGRLSADEAAKVQEHILLCPHCKPKFPQIGGSELVG